jgi:hypothetical protein
MSSQSTQTAIVLAFEAKASSKPYRKQVNKDDGFEMDGQKQAESIISKPFPASIYHADLCEIRYRIAKTHPYLKADSVRLLSDLMQTFRVMHRTEFKDYVNPCDSNIGKASLIEKFAMSSNYTFSGAFETIGATYPSWTQYWDYEGDKFQGKWFLRINGKGRRASLFRVNPALAVALADAIKVRPHLGSKKTVLTGKVVECTIL